MGFCFACGAQLTEQVLENRTRLMCDHCGWVHYPQLKVSAAALITEDDRILLARRSHDPWRECWYLPAGYVEADEDPEEAAIREVFEEVGLRIAITRLWKVYYFDDDPRGNGILIVYRCSVQAGILTTSAEIDGFEYFSKDQLPELIAGAGHRQAVDDWGYEVEKCR